jgi:hypothetical protein
VDELEERFGEARDTADALAAQMIDKLLASGASQIDIILLHNASRKVAIADVQLTGVVLSDEVVESLAEGLIPELEGPPRGRDGRVLP